MTIEQKRPAIFLDRDGTITEECGYVNHPSRLKLIRGAGEAIRMCNEHGFLAVVVTNQAGVAHGHFTEAFVRDLHRHLDERFRAGGARIDAFYYCPHMPSARVEAYRTECECRKPKPGMVLQAQRDLDLDLGRSFIVGDQWSDLGLGRAAGLKTILVRTGYGPSVEALPRDGITADLVVDTLMDAVSWILRRPALTEGR